LVNFPGKRPRPHLGSLNRVRFGYPRFQYARRTGKIYQWSSIFFGTSPQSKKAREFRNVLCEIPEKFLYSAARSSAVFMGDSPPFEKMPSWAELNNLGDADLVARLIAGEHDALAVLFDRYHRLVFSVAVRILRDEGEAEEVVQTVFLNIFEDAINFDPRKGTLKVWLLQYAYHRSLHRLRSLSAQRVYLWEELDFAKEQGHVPNVELLHYCEQLLARLKPLQRQVLELTYFEGWTAREIADSQGRAAAVVRNDLYRALAKLRSLIGRPTEDRKRGLVEEQKGRPQVVDTRTI
jgi:RNA polymerase sigma-70 factor, ECF subfamily